MSRTRAVLGAFVILSALALGGCSDDDPQPKFGPTASATASSPTSSTTSGAEPGSAEAFVHGWFEALSLAMVSGETANVRELSTDACTSCLALADQIQSIYARGGNLKTAGWSVEEARPNVEVDGSPSFLLRVRQAERTLRDGKKVIDRTPMTKVPMSIDLSDESGEWQVRRLVILK